MYMVENYELLVLFHENSGKQQKHCLKPKPPTKNLLVKFQFSKKATKNYKIFTVNLTLPNKTSIESEDFVFFVAFFENTNFDFK